MNITVANNLPVEQLLQTASEFGLELCEQNIAQNMTDMGIGYLSLNRTISTLSGGELTRLHIAQYMASSSSIILAVDELSLGLDEISLRSILSKLEKLGKENQIWLVDHSQTVLETTKKRLYFGPGSGSKGGKLIDMLPKCEPEFPAKKKENGKTLLFKNLSCRNIQIAKIGRASCRERV